MPISRSKLLTPILAVVLFGVLVSAALAHPLGNFTINHYARIEAAADRMRIRYALDFAEIPTFQEKQIIDADGNSEISDAERAAYLEALVPGAIEKLALTIDGARVPLSVEPGSVELSFAPGQGGLEVMRVALWLKAPLSLAQSGNSIVFRDENYSERLGWRELVALGGVSAVVQNSNVPSEDVSKELTAYPETLLSNPLNRREATFTVVPGAGNAVSAPVSAANPITTGALGAFDRTRDEFGRLLTDNRDLTPPALALAFLAAMALGALHSFSPGHGKAVVGAYLVGSRGNWQHAVFLGFVVTATHTAGVYALGFVTLFLSAYVLPEQLFPWLGFISGLLVALIGFQLCTQRYRAARSGTTSFDLARERLHSHENEHSDAHTHEHVDASGHSHAHSHEHEDEHEHEHEHQHELVHIHADGSTHAHAFAPADESVGYASSNGSTPHAGGNGADAGLTHTHSHDFATPEEEEAHAREHLAEIKALEKPSWKNLLSLGISGGLLPCPSALVVMLSAIALGRVLYGLFLIVGFSFGLAGVLVITGLALLYAGKFAGKYMGGRKTGIFMRYIPLVGAAFVVVLGLGIAIESVLQTSFVP